VNTEFKNGRLYTFDVAYTQKPKFTLNSGCEKLQINNYNTIYVKLKFNFIS
jgi:hypothetical protein